MRFQEDLGTSAVVIHWSQRISDFGAVGQEKSFRKIGHSTATSIKKLFIVGAAVIMKILFIYCSWKLLLMTDGARSIFSKEWIWSCHY